MEHQSFITDTLRHITQLLGIAVDDIVIEQDEHAASFRVIIKTKDSAILIGEHGARLLALNHLMKRIAEKRFPDTPLSFHVDVNDYQKKRVDDIRAKAHMLAERARYFKSSVDMEPMSSYERMIVHAEFTETADITTESSGQGKDRHVVIRFKEVITDL